jgi:hypothetical protein
MVRNDETLFHLLQEGDEVIDHYHRHNFYAHSHLHGVHTADFFAFSVPKFGPMADWDRVPSLVRIILVVPRESCAVLETSSETPLLQCKFKVVSYKQMLQQKSARTCALLYSVDSP